MGILGHGSKQQTREGYSKPLKALIVKQQANSKKRPNTGDIDAVGEINQLWVSETLYIPSVCKRQINITVMIKCVEAKDYERNSGLRMKVGNVMERLNIDQLNS